tara:strand:+ start:344 stop:625 length:282 start_codon:yes stop_codon:yes gene_type:complete
MTETLTYTINNLRRDSEDVVKEITYTLEIKRGEVAFQNCGIIPIEGEVTIPFADITKEKAIEWLKDTLGSEEVEKNENQLRVLFLPSGLPWTE